MANSNIEISEGFFQSIDIIVDERLKSIACDVTDICEIVDDSDAKNGNYWVSTNNGITQYKAISESDKYKKDEKVRVSIPNGDYEGDKYIVGKCVDDQAITPITYISPLESIVDVSDNLLSESKQIALFGLVANGAKKEIPLWSADLSLDKNYQDLQATGIYNTITLQAQFRTLLGEYKMRSGTYGLRLDIYVRLNANSDKYIVRSVYLDSSEMFGNPYNFVLFSLQSKKFDLSQLGTVDKMSLWFYQNNDFTYYDNTTRETLNVPSTIKMPNDEAVQLEDNLLLKNIRISFGSDLSVIADNTIQCYSLDSRDYRYSVTEADNQKRIGFLWYNKNDKNQYLGFSDGLVDFTDTEEYVVKKNKDWSDVTEDDLDSTGKPIEEFKRVNSKVVLEPLLNIDNASDPGTKFIYIKGQETPVGEETQPIDDLLDLLDLEVVKLKSEVEQNYLKGKIEQREYDGLIADINGYKTEYSLYINNYKTKYINYIKDLRAWQEAPPEEKGKRPIPPDDIIKQTYHKQIKQKPAKIRKIKDYSEFDYMDESAVDARLVGQMGRENVPSDKFSLTLSADLSDAKPLMEKTFNLITKDLITDLRNFNSRTAALNCTFKDKLNFILSAATKDENDTPYSDSQTIGVWYTETKKMFDTLCKVCSQYLALNYRNQEYLKLLEAERVGKTVEILEDEKELSSWYLGEVDPNNSAKFIKEPKYDIYKLVASNFDKIYAMIDDVFNTAKTELTGDYSGYKAIYDTYNSKVQKIKESIKENVSLGDASGNNVGKISALFKDIYATLVKLDIEKLNEQTYPEYSKRDFTNFDNRYAIYWYRYEPGYIDNEDKLIKVDWKRLQTKKDFGIPCASENESDLVHNFGLPIYDDFINKDEEYYFSVNLVNTPNIVTRLMDGNRTEEKYKVILFYNHEMYESNEITFKNLDEIPDPASVDKTDAIVIKHGEDSLDVYQSYAINNFLSNAADAQTPRNISVHYQGLKSGDEMLADAQVYWYIPNTSTMITYDNTYLTDTLGFGSDLNISDGEKPDYSREGYVCFYKKIGITEVDVEDDPETEETESGKKKTAKEEDLKFVYKIKDYYLSTSSDNAIVCKVVKNDFTFETELVLSFASLGSSGTDYTLSITPATNQIATKLNDPLELKFTLYDYNNNEIPINDKSALLAENGAFDFKLEWEGPTSYDALDFTYGENNAVVGTKVQLLTTPQSPESKIFGILKASAFCPIKYEPKAEEDIEEDEETGTDKEDSRDVQLIAYYTVPYSSGDYYIEGATSIVYDSMGANPSYYKDPYNIFKRNTKENLANIKIKNSAGKETEKNKYDILWKTVYYKKGSKNTVEKISKDSDSDYNFYRQYLPTINSKNGLNVSPMFLDNIDCYCNIECWIKNLEKEESNYSLAWSQPLLIIQNRYPSAMLNSWDGSLEIDRKNGTIMSSLLGAGRKSEHNTFEGILMGDVEAKTDIIDEKNKSGMGLYGFHDGAQSFGFRTDGTGFIGKDGRSRIEFDGNKGVIKSASYFEKDDDSKGIMSFGMKIDLDDGYLDIKGGTEYTPMDWAQQIVRSYKEILDSGVIPDSKIPTKTQKALLVKITDYLKSETSIATLNNDIRAYISGLSSDNSYRQLYGDHFINIDNREKKYCYALSILRWYKMLKKFSAVEGEDTIVYDFPKKYYNIIINKADEFILSETYDGSYAMDDTGKEIDNYKTRYGKLSKALRVDQTDDTYKGLTHQSQVHLDVKSPYFYVISEKGKRLINISDTRDESPNWTGYTPAKSPKLEPTSGYYLKSNNFSYADFKTKDGEETEAGSGFLLDLDSGYINSYNLSIASKFLFLDGTVEAGSGKPFFIIKDADGCNLLYASANTETKEGNFYIQSHSYSEYKRKEGNPPAGMRIDLKKGSIDAFNFSIKGISTETNYIDSYIELNSNPELTMYLKETDTNGNLISDVKLMEITPRVFRLKSKTWSDTKTTTVTTTKNGSATTKNTDKPITTRTGAGTNFSKASDIAGNTAVVLYAGPVTGKDTSENGIGNWYRIDTKRWIHSSNLVSITKPTTESSTEPAEQGLIFDVNNGYLKASHNGKDLYINSEAGSYPIQIGKKNNYNLQLGWDGSLQGGSTYDWSINEAGVATFSHLIANGGELNWCSIGNADITNGTISNATMGGGSLSDADLQSCTIANCTVTTTLNFGSTIGGGEGEEGVSGYTCSVDMLDASYYTYSFNTASVISSLTYDYWRLLGINKYTAVRSITTKTRTVLESVTPKKHTRQYQVVRASDIKEKSEDESAVGGSEESGGSQNGYYYDDLDWGGSGE